MNKILALILVAFSFLNIPCLAEEYEEVVVHDLGEYKIVAEKLPAVFPHGGPNYVYGNYGVIDGDNNVVVEKIYGEIYPHVEGRALFRIDGNIGFFDENWNVKIEPVYFTNRYPISIRFSEGLAAIGKKDDERYIVWGYIDKEGNEVIDFIYDSAEPFKDGVAEVGIKEEVYNYNYKTKIGKIDKEGKVIEPFKFGYYYGNDYLWEEDVLDVIPSVNDVEINGRRYKNEDIKYPFINYLGISFIPLTYYGCRMMGVNCDWTKQDGLILESGGEIKEDITGENDILNGVYQKAEIYKGKITINGKVYEYGDTSYPLLHFKNVIYMPVLWQKGMEELNIKYSYYKDYSIEDSSGCMIFTVE